jgi:leucyl aminopeptidase
MNVVTSSTLSLAAGAAAVLFLHEGDAPAGLTLEAAAAELVTGVWKSGDFTGKKGQSLLLYVPGGAKLMLAGLGKSGSLTRETLRQAAGGAARALREAGAAQIQVAVPAASTLGWKAGEESDAEGVANAVAEGALLGLYQFTEYRTQDLEDVKRVSQLSFVAPDGAQADLDRGLATAQVIADAIGHVRTLILHPSSVLTPTHFAEEAKRLGGEVGLTVRSLGESELEKLGFGLLLAVGRGSDEPSQFIVMEWKGGPEGEAPIVVVGKGMTFDTGGLGIKPGPGMEKMKYDMGGGGATLGILWAIAKLGLKRNVIGLIAAAENMPGAAAVKPGDVVTSYGGLTVEINDTDAEGRLVLADALAYAVKDLKAQAIVDMATLTGAVGVALGLEIAGAMGNHQGMVERVIACGERVGEKAWQLPLDESFDELVKSDIADLKNYGGRYAGASAAARFLEKFVGETPWVHLDIAGTGWTDKEKGYRVKGPTGAPLRTVVDLVRGWEPLDRA